MVSGEMVLCLRLFRYELGLMRLFRALLGGESIWCIVWLHQGNIMGDARMQKRRRITPRPEAYDRRQKRMQLPCLGLLAACVLGAALLGCSSGSLPDDDPSELLLAVPECESLVSPAWSRDGKSLFFLGYEPGKGTFLYSYDAARRTWRRLAGPFRHPSFNWVSVDAMKGVVVEPGKPEGGPEGRKVVSVDLTSGESQTLYVAPAGWMLTWSAVSPDGHSIAVVRNKLGEAYQGRLFEDRLFLLRGEDGFKASDLLAGSGTFVGDLHWSPDSDYLFCTTGKMYVDEGNPLVFDHSGSSVAMPRGEVDTFGSWSPDSQEIVYCCRRQLRVWSMRTRSARRLARLPSEGTIIYSHSAPKWSPDGKWVCYPVEFRDGPGCGEQLWLVSSEGTKNVRLGTYSLSKTERKGEYAGSWEYPTWTPDGKAITFVRGNTIRILRLPSELSANSSETER